MTTLNSYLTLADWADRQKPGGGIADIVEVLATSNPILQDAHIEEGNLATGHVSVQRTSQPSGTWRLLNKGVSPSKSATEQVTDTCGILEDYSQLDVDIASLNADERAFRASEDNAFIAGMTSTVATALFYGNTDTDPEQIMGFGPRYDSLTGAYGDYIINAEGSGSDNTSIWFVTWGPQACFLFYPKGSKKAGLDNEDMGRTLIQESDGTKWTAWVTRFQWKLGLAVRDYRRVVRICNIDVSELTADASSGTDLLDKMIEAYYARPTQDLGSMAKTYVYCNKTVAKILHKQAMNKSNVNLTIDNVAGKPIVSFLDAPIHVCDAILSTESAVS